MSRWSRSLFIVSDMERGHHWLHGCCSQPLRLFQRTFYSNTWCGAAFLAACLEDRSSRSRRVVYFEAERMLGTLLWLSMSIFIRPWEQSEDWLQED